MRIRHNLQSLFSMLSVATALCAAVCARAGAEDLSAAHLTAQPAASEGASSRAPLVVDDRDPGWTWIGTTPVSDPRFHSGTAQAARAGSSGVYTFSGTGVTVVGYAGRTFPADGAVRRIGTIVVIIDGKKIGSTALASESEDYQHTLFETSSLAAGNHVLELDAMAGWIVVDDIVISGAGAPVAADPGKLYRIVSKLAPNDYLQTSRTNLPDGEAIAVGPRDPEMNDTWRLTSLGPDTIRISPANAPEMALALSKIARVDPVKNTHFNAIIITRYTGAPEQQWTKTAIEDKWTGITLAGNPQLYFNVWMNSGFIVGYVDTYPTVSDNELWTLTPVSNK